MNMYMVPPEGLLILAIAHADYETYRTAGWREATAEEVATWPHLLPDGRLVAATAVDLLVEPEQASAAPTVADAAPVEERP